MTTSSAKQTDAEAPVNGRRVLVAEDSSITHELLKLLLNQRGHEVDIATDGRQALEALREKHYDVALLDFHLPSMDGAQVAAAIRSEAKGGRRTPRLIAITADVEGLLAHAEGCENFDHVMPKPLDIYQVGKTIEEQAEIGDRMSEAAAAPAALEAHAEQTPEPQAPKPSLLESLGYEFLVWPDDLDTTRLSPRAMQASLGDARFDAILIKERATADELSSIWRRKALHVLPVIDLTGTLGAAADLDAAKINAHDRDEIDRVVRRFQDQRAQLHRDLLFSDNLGEQLLGRMFVSARPLLATFDPESRNLVSYNTILSPAVVAREAEALCGQELLARDFFDRLHVCGRCDSKRLHVREECPKCRSSHLGEDQYLHHFRCAYQGAEADFRSGDALVCPKCRRELSHFGFDYDRPGTMLVCRSCGQVASEPAMGFVCLDCGAHADAESCRTVDSFSYQLTEQGRGFAQYGNSFHGRARQSLRFADLPLELIVALNAAAKRFNEERIPFTLVNIFYQNEREITAEQGARQFSRARDLFVENLRAELGHEGIVIRGQSYDFALLRNVAPEQAQRQLDTSRDKASSTLRADLGAKFQSFGPEDFS